MSIITVTVGSYTFDETQIILNPTISKSICSGGFSVGNTACGCLKIGVPDHLYSDGTSVKIFYGGQQIMGEFFISDIEKCGYAKLKPTDTYKTQMVMLTCYDGMSKLDDYMSFDLTTVTPADICNGIESKTGYLFETGSKLGTSFDIPKEEAESRTMREWLGIFGCYIGCNWSIRTYWLNDVLVSRITQLPLYYSEYSFSAVINAPVTVENAVTFSRVVSRGKDGTFKSGADTDYTLEISCQYATQTSNDIIQGNITNQAVPYTAFKCDKLKTAYTFMDIGDEITLSGHSGGLKIYNQTVTISINGIYMSVGADVQKKTLNEDVDYSSGGGGDGLENVTNFQGGTSGNTGIVNLTWVKPSSAQNVIVKRKRSTPFNNVIDDGDIIAVTSGNTLADTLPSLWYSYYYRTLTNAGDLYNGKDNSIMIPAITRGKYLYNVGDRCTAITGGWYDKALVTDIPNLSSGYTYFESTHIRLYAKYVTGTYLYSAVQTANKVDFTGFTKLCAEFQILSLNTYDLTENADYTTIRNRDMPYYSYADTYYNSSYPAVTPEQCPYVIASYCTNSYGIVYYSVMFTDKKPRLYYNSDRQICIAIEATSNLARTVQYNAKTLAVYQKYNTINTTVLKLKCPVDTPDTLITDYMGGAYSEGYTYCYAFDGFTDAYKIPDTRFFIGTRSQDDGIYNDLVTKAYKTYPTGVGTFVIEAAITDLDTSVVPNIPRGYVLAGAFESDVKLLSVWLKE